MNLRGGVFRQFIVEFLFDHTNDIPIANSACSSGSLLAAGLTRPHQFEVLHFAFDVEAHLLRKAKIDHVLDT